MRARVRRCFSSGVRGERRGQCREWSRVASGVWAPCLLIHPIAITGERFRRTEWLTREGTLTRGTSGSIRRECDAKGQRGRERESAAPRGERRVLLNVIVIVSRVANIGIAQRAACTGSPLGTRAWVLPSRCCWDGGRSQEGAGAVAGGRSLVSATHRRMSAAECGDLAAV